MCCESDELTGEIPQRVSWLKKVTNKLTDKFLIQFNNGFCNQVINCYIPLQLGF